MRRRSLSSREFDIDLEARKFKQQMTYEDRYKRFGFLTQ